MKITSLDCWVHKMPLAIPYSIAYETVDHCENVFMKAGTDTGITGWGCAAPDKAVTGESGETVLRIYRDIIDPLLKNADPFRYALLIEKIKKHASGNPSAMAMADMCLYDLMAKKAGEPLYKFLGGYRKKIPTSITIGILPLNETVEAARNMIRKGFNILKIKGGRNLAEDIEKVIRLRIELGKKIEIRFDANQGYSAEEAVTFIRETKKAGIGVFEQPTNRTNEDSLGSVTARVPVPVMADESLMTLGDVFRLTKKDLIDMINIKIMKVGGIYEALHINSVAKSAGVESMIGCMDESELGVAAGLHFALARSNVIYADLDGHLDLQDDPFRGMIRLKEGVLYPGEGAGLGEIDF